MERAIPILPSRDLGATIAFYARLGFRPAERGPEHLVLERGALELHFAKVVMATNAMCLLRVDDAAALHAAWTSAGLALGSHGEHTLVDPDGSLVRIASDAQPADLPAGWRLVGGRLEKSFRFPDWAGAFAFVTRVSALAERLNHHPDVTLAWGRVDLSLWSHDVKRVTERDTRLARAIDGC